MLKELIKRVSELQQDRLERKLEKGHQSYNSMPEKDKKKFQRRCVKISAKGKELREK